MSGEHQVVKEKERAGQENGREVAKNMVFQKGERRPGKGPCSSHTAQAIFGPSRALHTFPRHLGALTTEGTRIPWNSSAFHLGLLSPAGSRPLLPRGLKSASSWGSSHAAWGNPGVPLSPPPHPSGNPSTSCCLGLTELKTFLWAPVLRGRGSWNSNSETAKAAGKLLSIFLKEEEER